MPPVPMAKHDAAEIERLIKERGWTVTRFARMLGRNRKSIGNIKYKEAISTSFICQMATALGVKRSQISDMPDDDDHIVPPALAS